MPAKIAFHIDPDSLLELFRRTHGRLPIGLDQRKLRAGEIAMSVEVDELAKSLAHHLTKAAGRAVSVTPVHIEKFNLDLPGEKA